MKAMLGSKQRVWISRMSALIFVVGFLLIRPLCYCPRYFLTLACVGLVPALAGPNLYRWLGGAAVAVALFTAAVEWRAATRSDAQIAELRASSEAQPPSSER